MRAAATACQTGRVSGERESVRVARVALRANDPPRSAAFYGEVVGLEEVPASGADAVALGPPGSNSALVELRRSAGPGPAPRRATGLFHTAFRYPERAQLAAALRRLAAGRTPLTGASHHLVSEALYLDDPDGIGIELYRDLPRADWPSPAAGERVRMDTLPLDLDSVLAEPEPEGDAGSGADVGHAHLKVADVEDAVGFWSGAVGLDLMTRFGPQAAFLATGGYHHHIGVNSWMSAGAPPEPADGPGLDFVVLAVAGDPGLQDAERRLAGAGAAVERRNGAVATRTPDGVAVLLEEAGGG